MQIVPSRHHFTDRAHSPGSDRRRRLRRGSSGASVFAMRTQSAASSSAQGHDYVQSLDRGLSVIRAFSHDDPRLTLSDVARATGLTRAAARRFLLTLQRLGYVDSDDREFYLTPRVLEL